MTDPTSRVSPRLLLVLRCLFLAVVAVAVWQVYRSVPRDDERESARRQTRESTRLSVAVDSLEFDADDLKDVEIRFSPVDLIALEREMSLARKRDETLNAFVKRRTQGREIHSVKLDLNASARLELAAGRWWIFTRVRDARTHESYFWRMPVNVRGRNQHIELNRRNADARVKEF